MGNRLLCREFQTSLFVWISNQIASVLTVMSNLPQNMLPACILQCWHSYCADLVERIVAKRVSQFKSSLLSDQQSSPKVEIDGWVDKRLRNVCRARGGRHVLEKTWSEPQSMQSSVNSPIITISSQTAHEWVTQGATGGELCWKPLFATCATPPLNHLPARTSPVRHKLHIYISAIDGVPLFPRKFKLWWISNDSLR